MRNEKRDKPFDSTTRNVIIATLLWFRGPLCPYACARLVQVGLFSNVSMVLFQQHIYLHIWISKQLT